MTARVFVVVRAVCLLCMWKFTKRDGEAGCCPNCKAGREWVRDAEKLIAR